MKVASCVKIFFVFGVFLVKDVRSEPLRCEIMAPIAILINAENGKVLFEKNSTQVCHPASTTKLATAFYAMHKKGKDLDQLITASPDAIGIVSSQVRRNSGKHPSYRLEFGGTHAGIKVGEQLDLKSLLYAAMLASGNDASNVVAESVSGSIPKFIEELNLFLRAIGCKHTYFTNPHGLPDHRHVTTAFDLALMARFAKKNPVFQEIVMAMQYERPQTNKQEASLLRQTNGLLKPGKYYYPYATGIKTGYTQQAGFNLVASAQKGDRDLIAVVCNCQESAQRYRTVVQLFESAFNEPKQERKLLSQEYDLFHKKFEGAQDTLHAVLSRDVTVSFYPSEEKEFHSEVIWYPLELPIEEREEVGCVQLFDQDGKFEKKISLLASRRVDPTFMYKVEKKMKCNAAFMKRNRAYFGYGMALGILSISFLLVKRKRLKTGRDNFF